MRTFFIFDINDSYYSLYKDYPYSIYNLLNQIYKLKDNNLIFSKNLLLQLVNKIDKEIIDKDLFLRLHKDLPYSKRGEKHMFNNFYFGEITSMVVHNNYIKIKSSKDQNYFLKNLNYYNKHFFVCDFNNGDYFFLDNILVYN